jgi:hypothetical protein
VADTLTLVGLNTEMVLSPEFAMYTYPPLGCCTIATGLTPTHTVFVATSDAVLITLTDPVDGQKKFVPEFAT